MSRRDLVIAFIVTALVSGIAVGYTLAIQRIVRSNQCDVLNRLAETKVFMRGFLRESTPDADDDPKRFKTADRHLTEGVRDLREDVRRTPGCDLFPQLSGDLDELQVESEP